MKYKRGMLVTVKGWVNRMSNNIVNYAWVGEGLLVLACYENFVRVGILSSSVSSGSNYADRVINLEEAELIEWPVNMLTELERQNLIVDYPGLSRNLNCS